VTLLSTQAFSASFQAEVGVAYADLDNDTTAIGIRGIGYFEAVNTDKHPLAEAAFLEDASNVELMHVMGTNDEFDFDIDIDITALSLNYYIPNTDLFASAILMRTSVDAGPIDDSENDWGISAGYSPIDNLLIKTTYFDDIDYEINLDAKYVHKLVNDTAVNVEASYAKADIDDSFGISADYYFNNKMSLGARVVSVADTDFGIQGKVFLADNFFIGASYLNGDSKIIDIEAGVRF
jgi:hypothetical protein